MELGCVFGRRLQLESRETVVVVVMGGGWQNGIAVQLCGREGGGGVPAYILVQSSRSNTFGERGRKGGKRGQLLPLISCKQNALLQ